MIFCRLIIWNLGYNFSGQIFDKLPQGKTTAVSKKAKCLKLLNPLSILLLTGLSNCFETFYTYKQDSGLQLVELDFWFLSLRPSYSHSKLGARGRFFDFNTGRYWKIPKTQIAQNQLIFTPVCQKRCYWSSMGLKKKILPLRNYLNY